MSLITSCPACGTMFRVVPDQLKISEGWVRCGHCSEVFDASAHMVDESVLEQLRTAEAAARPPEVPSFLAATPPARRPEPPPEEADSWLPSTGFPDSMDPATQPAPEAAPVEAAAMAAAERTVAPPLKRQDDSGYLDAVSHALEPSPLDGPFVFRRSDLMVDDLDPSTPPAPTERRPRGEDDEEEYTEEQLHDVSFMRQARRRAFWRRPGVRGGLLVAAFVLGALLALQVAWHDRDRLALQQPALRPALAQMCALLQCRLGAPRQIESIVIESSGFTRVRNDIYRLAFTVRNTARTQVALPAMELTITDAQDQAIARRVLLPGELGAPGEALGQGAEWTGAVGVSLTMPNTSRVAGYRLLAFYP